MSREAKGRPTSKSFAVQCNLPCKNCDLHDKALSKVVELVMQNEQNSVVCTKILKLMRFCRATAKGQTDVGHPYKNCASNKNHVGEVQAAADHSSKSIKPEQTKNNQEAKLSNKVQAKNVNAAETSKSKLETGKIIPSGLPTPNASGSKTTSCSKTESNKKGPSKNTPSQASVPKVVPAAIVAKNAPMTTASSVDTQPSSKPAVPLQTKASAEKLKSTPGLATNQKPGNSQLKPAKTVPPVNPSASSVESSHLVLNKDLSETKPDLKKDKEIKSAPSTSKLETSKTEISEAGKKREASVEVEIVAELPSVEKDKLGTPVPPWRRARNTLAPPVTRGRGRGRFPVPLRRASRSRGFIPRGFSPRSRFPRASFNSHGDRVFAPPYYENDFSRDIDSHETFAEYLNPQHREEPWCEPVNENHGRNFGPEETFGQNINPQHQEDGPWFEPAHENHGPDCNPQFDARQEPSLGPQWPPEPDPNFVRHDAINMNPQHQEEGPWFEPTRENHGPDCNPHGREFQPEDNFRPQFGAPQEPNFIRQGRGRGRGFGHDEMGPGPMNNTFRGGPNPRFGRMRSRGRPPIWN